MHERADATRRPCCELQSCKEHSCENENVTGYLLIRHAAADHVGRRLAGRTPGVRLSDTGRAEARDLAAALAHAPLAAVYTSPLERARETAAPLAEPHGLDPVVSEAFQEVDFGDWTGLSFEELEGDAEWSAWNGFRSTARVPGGEAMTEVLVRALEGVREIGRRHEGGWVAVVSHCDVIRPLLAHFSGMPLDHLLRLEVATASVSAIEVNPWGPRIRGMNGSGAPAGLWAR